MSETHDLRVEVMDDHVLLVLPRKMDDFVTSWQQAVQLASVLEMASRDVPNSSLVVSPAELQRELESVRLNTFKGRFVVFLFGHTDRVRFSPEAAKLAARAIRLKAQDCELAERKVHLLYNKRGELKKIQNDKVGYTQTIPGR